MTATRLSASSSRVIAELGGDAVEDRGVVGVEAAQLERSRRAIDDDRVHRADPLGQRLDLRALLLQVPQRVFLVRQRDRQAGQVERLEREEALHERLEALVARVDEQRQVDAVVADLGERGVVDGRRHRVRDRRRDDAVDLRLRADRVPAVQPLHVVDRDLAGRGAAVLRRARRT